MRHAPFSFSLLSPVLVLAARLDFLTRLDCSRGSPFSNTGRFFAARLLSFVGSFDLCA